MSQEWIDKLQPFMSSAAYKDIFDLVEKERDKYNIFPEVSEIFNAFVACPYEKLKCIIIGQDPYFTKGVANGIAMCCEKTGKLQPSLRMFYDGINDSVYDGEGGKYYDPSLRYLADQGVLLINRALTVRANTPRSHLHIWEPFIEYLFMDVIHNYQRGLPIIMLGKDAQYVNRYISPLLHYPINVEHPAAASYQKRAWNCSNCFNKVNGILESNNGKEYTIKWLNGEYGKETNKSK